ncbi:MAG: hypothetical protein JNL82_17225 [Myxococcales bacterium]|nr:hypothetical protein [Myxococcales bacterium]
MAWLSRAPLVALMLTGCGPGGGSSADDSTSPPASSSSSASATDATSSTPVTGGATTTTGETGGTATATGTASTSSTGGPTTGAPATTTGEGPDTATAVGTTTLDSSGTAAGSETTAGPAGSCAAVGGEYGDCDAFLGYAFDGAACKGFSGCDCGPDCAHFFPGPVECAASCAAAGECREDIVEAKALAMAPIGPGSLCDEVDACVNSPELQAWLGELFPGLACEAGGFCDSGDNCHLLFQNILSQEQWTQVCAATLLPGIEQILCVVFGP